MAVFEDCVNANKSHINSKNIDGSTPLHLAMQNQSNAAKIVRYLVAHGANTTEPDNEGNTPFHEAAKEATVEVLEYLIEKGADIDQQNDAGQTPIIYASNVGDQANNMFLTKNMKYLINKG